MAKKSISIFLIVLLVLESFLMFGCSAAGTGVGGGALHGIVHEGVYQKCGGKANNTAVGRISEEEAEKYANREYASHAIINVGKARGYSDNAIKGILAYYMAEGSDFGFFSYESYYLFGPISGKPNDITLDNAKWREYCERGNYPHSANPTAFGISLFAHTNHGSPGNWNAHAATEMIDKATDDGYFWQDPQWATYYNLDNLEARTYDSDFKDPKTYTGDADEYARRVTAFVGMPGWTWNQGGDFIQRHCNALYDGRIDKVWDSYDPASFRLVTFGEPMNVRNGYVEGSDGYSSSSSSSSGAAASSSGSSSSGGGSSAPAKPNANVPIKKNILSNLNSGNLPKKDVKYIMLHGTGSGSASSAINSWTGIVGAHFVVDKDGTIYQTAELDWIVHHAGGGSPGSNELFGIKESKRDKNREEGIKATPKQCKNDYAMNSWSIGIEIVNNNSGSDEFPEAQLTALDGLIAYIDQEVGSSPEIITHKEWSGDAEHSRAKVQGQGKPDPADNFPTMQYKMYRSHLVSSGTESVDTGSSGGNSKCGGYSSAGGNSSIAEAAVTVAYDPNDRSKYPMENKGCGWSCTDSEAIVGYYNLCKDVGIDHGGTPYVCECSTLTPVAVRWAGADDNFPSYTGSELSYASGSDRWQTVGTLFADKTIDDLKPGDVLVNDSHTWVFCGNEEIQKRFPDSSCDSVGASLGDHAPQIQSASGYTYATWTIFRNIKPEEGSKYKEVKLGGSK